MIGRRLPLLLGIALAAAPARDTDPPIRADQARSAAGRIDAGIERAQARDWNGALDEFAAARERGSGEVWRCATFDWARALYERAIARSRPELPPTAPPPDAAEIANARASLGATRGDLEAARGGLIELVSAAPEDVEARAALARVALELREVLELDAAWRKLASRSADAARGGERASNAPLRAGPESARAAAGAASERPGAAETSPDPTRVAPADGDVIAGLPGEEDLRTLRERLRAVRDEARAQEERRAAAAAERTGRRG